MTKLTRFQVLAAAASAVVVAPQIVRAQTAEKIRICAAPSDAMMPVFWAVKNGLYEKAGLDVELVLMTSGTAAATAVISGAYELGQGSAIALLVAHLKNVPVTIVGNSSLWESKNPWAALIVAVDSTIANAADLNGKIVGCPALNDIASLATSVWVDKNGGDSKTLRWVEIPGSAAGAAVATNRVAACYATEPQLEAAMETGKVKALTPVLGSIASSYAVSAFFARPDWAQKNAVLMNRFVRATYESAAYSNTHPAETAPVLSEITKIDLPIIRKMVRIHSATTTELAMLQPVIDVAAKYGSISRAFPADELYFHA